MSNAGAAQHVLNRPCQGHHCFFHASIWGTISLAYRRRAARWQRTAKWWLPAAYTMGAVLEFIANNRRGVCSGRGFGVLFALLFSWRSYRSRRLPQHVERLRAAAAEIPEAAPAADTADSVTLAPRRMKTAVLLVVVVGIGFGAPRRAASTRG